MNNLNEEIGARIKAMRKSHGLTQEQLSERLDISVKHMSAVERGIASFSLERMIDLCAILDCDMDYLTRGQQRFDLNLRLPDSILDICRSEDPEDLHLLEEYLAMFKKLRRI